MEFYEDGVPHSSLTSEGALQIAQGITTSMKITLTNKINLHHRKHWTRIKQSSQQKKVSQIKLTYLRQIKLQKWNGSNWFYRKFFLSNKLGSQISAPVFSPYFLPLTHTVENWSAYITWKLFFQISNFIWEIPQKVPEFKVI